MRKALRNKTIYHLILILVITFQSCALFDKELINPNPLNKQNLYELDGRYDTFNIQVDSIEQDYKRPISINNSFLKEIDRKLIKDTLKLDNLKNYAFDIKIISTKKIKIEYFENGKVFKERVFKTKLKKDGYLYLKNKNVQFLLVPYIAGALDVKRTRFTKSIKGNLIFDVSNHRSGAAFLVVFLDSKTWKYRQEYERKEKKRMLNWGI